MKLTKPTTLFLLICIATGLLLGSIWSHEAWRYNETRHQFPLASEWNSKSWTLADWNKWKAAHWDRPTDDQTASPD